MVLWRPASLDELVDEVETQQAALTDEQVTRLLVVCFRCGGESIEIRRAPAGPEGPTITIPPEWDPEPDAVSGKGSVSGNPSSTIPESDPLQEARDEAAVEDRCLRCNSTEGWPVCPTCKAQEAATADEPRTNRGHTSDRPMFPTIGDWAEANGYDRPQGRPPRWAVEGWRKANPDAPEMPIERKLAAEAARRAQLSAAPPVETTQVPSGFEVFKPPRSKNRCTKCGAKLSGGAKRYGHTMCAPCRIVEAAQSTEQEKSPESRSESAPAQRETPSSEPQSAGPARGPDAGNSAGKSPENARSTVQPDKPPGKRCAGCGTVMAAFGDFDRCMKCRKADDAGPGSLDHEPLPNAASPPAGTLAAHLDRKCEDCGAKLSRFNDAQVCSLCQQKRIKANVAAVREGGYPRFERVTVDEAPSRESGVVAPRAKGDVVLSDGSIAAHKPGEARRDDKGRVICSTCNQPMIHFACGCDEGELDDDGIPLDSRWQDGVFIPDGDGLASTG